MQLYWMIAMSQVLCLAWNYRFSLKSKFWYLPHRTQSVWERHRGMLFLAFYNMLSIMIEICNDIKTHCEVGQSNIIVPFQMVKVKFIYQIIMQSHANNKWLCSIDSKGGNSLLSIVKYSSLDEEPGFPWELLVSCCE